VSELPVPLTLREAELLDRVVVSPVCQYSTHGVATDWQLAHLGSQVVGGAGTVLTAATAVSPTRRISPLDLGVWTDEQADVFGCVASFVCEHGAVPGIQLAHAGRKVSTAPPWEGGHPVAPDDGGWTAVGPSGTAYPYEGAEQPIRKAGFGRCSPTTASLFVRISTTDRPDDQPSCTVDDSAQLAPRLTETGVNLLDVSTRSHLRTVGSVDRPQLPAAAR
jgi:2,4-dienoyl-CoA reductase-like NADH-dependent reductase (Old Yellow Enzyme family)